MYESIELTPFYSCWYFDGLRSFIEFSLGQHNRISKGYLYDCIDNYVLVLFILYL